MKLLSRLLIALAICLITIPILAVPAQANGEDEPYIRLSPSSGHPGEEVTVRGYNFDSDEDVDIWYYPNGTRTRVATDETDDDGDFRVDFTVPESCSGDHEVRASVDGERESADFTVEPGLEITPEEGPVGTTVTVKGTGFGEDEEDIEVRYYLTSSNYERVKRDITADEDGSWETTFTVPPSSKGTHKIDAKGDDSSLSDVEDAEFEIKPGISLSKSSGYVGDTITVTGSGFKNKEIGVKVTYGGVQVGSTITADEYGAWTISFDIPASTKGVHKIDASGSSTSAATISDKNFTVSPKMTLSPTEGHVGTTLTLSGSGFAGGKRVTITYDASETGTATTNDKGSFSDISFSVPKSIHGNHEVKATDAGGNSVTATFVMESEAPAKPMLNSPANGSRAGFIGKVTPTFEWSSNVTDPSGVSYSLQIAKSDNFTTPVVSVTGLSGSSYTLTEEQALPHGTYYWRVKAIDGAQNDSGWTTAYSFKSGILPLWACIVIIALIVVLIGALFYFFVGRRGRYYN